MASFVQKVENMLGMGQPNFQYDPSAQQANSDLYANKGESSLAKWGWRGLGAAAAFEAMKMVENRRAKEGYHDHSSLREMVAAVAGAEAVKLYQNHNAASQGVNLQQAQQHAQQQALQMFDQNYAQQYGNTQGPQQLMQPMPQQQQQQFIPQQQQQFIPQQQQQFPQQGNYQGLPGTYYQQRF